MPHPAPTAGVDTDPDYHGVRVGVTAQRGQPVEKFPRSAGVRVEVA
jgi:hypothetical protein